MTKIWTVFVILSGLVKTSFPHKNCCEALKDALLSQDQYNEVLKEHQELLKRYARQHGRQMRSVDEDHNLGSRQKESSSLPRGIPPESAGAIGLKMYRRNIRAGILDRRRNTLSLSTLGKLRARKLELRRRKLTSQSLRSHEQHSQRQTTLENS